MKLGLYSAMAFLCISCSGQNNFSSKGPQKSDDGSPAVPTPTVPPPQTPTDDPGTETFQVGSNRPNVDMFWMIDNSGSMTSHIANVRKNFVSFLTKIEQIENVNFILYSAPEKAMNGTRAFGNLGLELPAQFQNKERFKHIAQPVGSYDILYLAAEAMCGRPGIPKSSTSSKPISLCETVYDPNLFKDAGDLVNSPLPENPLAKRGEALNLFRKDSIKIMVVVSDENSFGVNAKVFTQFLTSEGMKIKIFGFTGQEKMGFGKTGNACSIYYKGSAYIDLANQYSGKTFDLCDLDWSPNFDFITKEANAISQTNFVLKKPAADIESVHVNNLPVEYTMSAGMLVLSKMPNTGDTVKVKYKN